MRTRVELARHLLDNAHGIMADHLRTLTPDDALAAAGGYRSILGILKHTAGWSDVYHSYAFEPEPRHWDRIEWPRGLPADVVDLSPGYLEDLRGWLARGYEQLTASLAGLPDGLLEEPRPVHWGATVPLFEIIVMVANHWTYRAGEVNAIVSIERGLAWKYTEEVEENHISTAGHRIRPVWMSDEGARRYEAYRAERDAELRSIPLG